MSYQCTCGAPHCKVWVSRSCKYRHELAKLLAEDADVAQAEPPVLPNEDLAAAPHDNEQQPEVARVQIQITQTFLTFFVNTSFFLNMLTLI